MDITRFIRRNTRSLHKLHVQHVVLRSRCSYSGRR